jgi:hypothetical protein
VSLRHEVTVHTQSAEGSVLLCLWAAAQLMQRRVRMWQWVRGGRGSHLKLEADMAEVTRDAICITGSVELSLWWGVNTCSGVGGFWCIRPWNQSFSHCNCAIHVILIEQEESLDRSSARPQLQPLRRA